MTFRLKQLSVAVGLAFGLVSAHAAVGRVLLASGDEVFAERGGQRVPLRVGADIEVGDVLLVGERSALQVRFLDESLASLRSNSRMQVEAFQHDRNKSGSDHLVLSLLKGGLRTVTGLIGKNNPDGFGLKTATATVGIRGTHFTALHCAADCFNANGSPVADGTYGGVTDGTIGVGNQAGEVLFRQQEYFYVANQNSLPSRLLQVPRHLSDRNLEARGRAVELMPRAQALVAPKPPVPAVSISTSPLSVTPGVTENNPLRRRGFDGFDRGAEYPTEVRIDPRLPPPPPPPQVVLPPPPDFSPAPPPLDDPDDLPLPPPPPPNTSVPPPATTAPPPVTGVPPFTAVPPPPSITAPPPPPPSTGPSII